MALAVLGLGRRPRGPPRIVRHGRIDNSCTCPRFMTNDSKRRLPVSFPAPAVQDRKIHIPIRIRHREESGPAGPTATVRIAAVRVLSLPG